MIQKIKQVLRINSYFDKLSRNVHDSSATILLHKLFPASTILSFTPFSLNPNTMLHLINEIQINQRKQIIEFGSGISTIVMAKFIKDNKLSAKILSIEDNEEWFNYIMSELIKYNLEGIVNLNYVPLKKENQKYAWYKKERISDLVLGKKFDMVLVDGPSAKNGTEVRMPAVEMLLGSLNEEFIIFLDDIRRTGERKILNSWENILLEKNYRVKKQFLDSKVYGTITCGKSFSSYPLSY